MSKLPNYHACFVCGDRNDAGLHVRFRWDGERASTDYTPEIQHMGFQGRSHGGVMAALLDETMGWAPAMVNQRFCVTVEMTIEYRKPLPIGHTVVVSGWLTGGDRRIWETKGEIRDAEGNLYARGRGRYMPMSETQTRDVMTYLQFDEGCVAPEMVCPPESPNTVTE